MTTTQPAHAPQVQHVLESKARTVNDYLDEKVRHYRGSCYLSELTCARLARIALCREVRAELGLVLLYRSAARLLSDTPHA